MCFSITLLLLDMPFKNATLENVVKMDEVFLIIIEFERDGLLAFSEK